MAILTFCVGRIVSVPLCLNAPDQYAQSEMVSHSFFGHASCRISSEATGDGTVVGYKPNSWSAKPVFVTEQASLRVVARLPSMTSMSCPWEFRRSTFEGQTQSPLGLGWGRRQIVC